MNRLIKSIPEIEYLIESLIYQKVKEKSSEEIQWHRRWKSAKVQWPWYWENSLDTRYKDSLYNIQKTSCGSNEVESPGQKKIRVRSKL